MRIKLAANGLPALYALLERAGSLEALGLSAIKCPLSPQAEGEVRRARRFGPVLLHGWGPPQNSVTLPLVPLPEQLGALARLSGTPHLSTHLDHTPALDGELDEAALLERVAVNGGTLRRAAGIPLLLENVPWYPWGARTRRTSDPGFIRAALDAAGADLLLDLAHARVACWQRGEDVREYLEALPLERVRELHVSGPRLEPGGPAGQGGLRDRHRTLEPADWALLAWTLERVPRLEWLTSEYTAGVGEDGPELLAGELARLRALT